jgi:prepilin-type N-terminal cleavage/methylation domain-containing protein
MTRRGERGVTLMELLIAISLMSMLVVGIMMSFRIGLSAMNKVDSKLMANRRAASIERILEQETASIMPVTADCQGETGTPPKRITFFQGEPQTMRFASAFSLQEASRGMPMILEFQVIPGAEGRGVRLVVNERLYTGPRSTGQTCAGVFPDPITSAPTPRFLPIQVGATSFVLADKLAYCRFVYREFPPLPDTPKWVGQWVKPVLPNAIRIEMAPLVPDASKLEPLTMTIPVRVTRLPLGEYVN